MKVAAISDVHVKIPHDEADQLLCRFLTHPTVTDSDYVLLLGDIFDLMCGPHSEYLEKFQHIFDHMDQLIKNGKKVFFFEGNHDVHLEKLFEKIWPEGDITLSQLPKIELLEGKTYYFSHGDEHEVNNHSYQRYKKLILSPPLRFVANKIMPYSVLNYIGERASKMSRKRGSKQYDEQAIKMKFREGVLQTTGGDFNFILGGHSHVQDSYPLNDHSIYVNNGYALKTKTFIFIEDHKIQFMPLV